MRSKSVSSMRNRSESSPIALIATGQGDCEPSAHQDIDDECAFKVCAVVGNRFFSIYDGRTEYVLGHTSVTHKLSPIRKSGYFVFPKLEDAIHCPFPANSQLMFAPKAILRVRVGGRKRRYSHDRVECESVTPVELVARLIRNGR